MFHKLRGLLILPLAGVFTLSPAFESAAHADPGLGSATIYVSDRGTLENAFATADADPGTIYDIYVLGGSFPYVLMETLALTQGQVNLHGPTGDPAGLVIDAQGAFQAFTVIGGTHYSNPNLNIDGITIQNGLAGPTTQGGGILVANGGGVYLSKCIVQNNGAGQPGSGIAVDNAFLNMDSVLVRGNVNTQFNSCGGGLTSGGGGLFVGEGAYVYVNNSTFTGNKACRGGGILVGGISSSLFLQNSTVSGNEAKFRGGGVFFQGGSGYHGFMFSTIAYNTAGTAFSSVEKRYGGGIGVWDFGGTLEMFGNVLANNSVVNDSKSDLFYKGSDCFVQYDQQSSFLDYNGDPITGIFDPSTVNLNFIGDESNCHHLAFGSRVGWEGAPLDAMLAPLTTNGSTSSFQLPNHMPQPGSPVIGAYHAREATFAADWPFLTDERGYQRASANQGQSDIGAIEFNGAP